LAALNNTDYFFVYSEGCNAGQFDGQECLAEAFTTKSAHGAFAVVMNAREGLAGPSEDLHRWFWDPVFNPNANPPLECYTYAAANQYSKEKQIPTLQPAPEPGQSLPMDFMRWCIYGANFFGDPSLVIRLPQSP
jgi:hypothetical protein